MKNRFEIILHFGVNVKRSIVFFGSGPVASESLKLLMNDFSIEATITKPSTNAVMSGLTDNPVYSVSTRSELNKLFSSHQFKSKLAILIDFGLIINQEIIDYFPLGIINSHFSLLPQWRGADPISFAILSGQKTTGVSLMLLVEKMDEGPLLAQSSISVSPTDTGPSLTTKLVRLSGQLIRQTIPKYIDNKVKPQPQKLKGVSYSRKLTKQDGVINWQKPASQIEREIRAFASWPKSHTFLGKQEVTISQAQTVSYNQTLQPGQISVDRKQLLVGTGDGTLEIMKLKPIGKKEMSARDFLNGYLHKINQ